MGIIIGGEQNNALYSVCFRRLVGLCHVLLLDCTLWEGWCKVWLDIFLQLWKFLRLKSA